VVALIIEKAMIWPAELAHLKEGLVRPTMCDATVMDLSAVGDIIMPPSTTSSAK